LNVGKLDDGTQINMVVTILEASGDSKYLNHVKKGNQSNWDSAPQNRILGKFAQINIKADHQADMQFCFVNHGSKAPVTIDAFSVTFHDFDNAGSGENLARERLIASGYTSWATSFQECDISQGVGKDIPMLDRSPSELVVDAPGTAGLVVADGDSMPDYAEVCTGISGTESGTEVAFASSTDGNGNDNPTDPANLSEQQRKRAVTLTYQEKQCIVVTFSVPLVAASPLNSISNKFGNGAAGPDADKDKQIGFGRNFLFSGGSLECMQTPTTPVHDPPTLCPIPTDKPCRVTSECTEGETCIPYRRRQLVRGSATKMKERMRKRGLRKLLFSVAPVVGSCGYTAGNNNRPDGTVCTGPVHR